MKVAVVLSVISNHASMTLLNVRLVALPCVSWMLIGGSVACRDPAMDATAHSSATPADSLTT